MIDFFVNYTHSVKTIMTSAWEEQKATEAAWLLLRPSQDNIKHTNTKLITRNGKYRMQKVCNKFTPNKPLIKISTGI